MGGYRGSGVTEGGDGVRFKRRRGLGRSCGGGKVGLRVVKEGGVEGRAWGGS